MEKVYACIDLKSFYASVECVERNLNPLTTNLVVADNSRTEKTICLAVTPSLKQYGLSGRSRLFEVTQKVREINRLRKEHIKGKFTGKSYDDKKLKSNPKLELDFIIAPPRMKYYMKYSTNIYNIYLKFLSSEDIYVYSIDEVFCDLTSYLKLYKKTPEQIVTMMVKSVYEEMGITATAGIGTNLYLAKIAMDIVAKHVDANADGVRIAYLDEYSYRKELWNHRPLSDFWRVGRGISNTLNNNGIYSMGQIARTSIENENLLYRLFGVNAELLIDHAWGYEPCTIKDIKSYKPINNSLSSGQVLHEPYDYKKTKLIVREMIELLVLEMFEKHYVTDQIVLTIGYDNENLSNPKIRRQYNGVIEKDHYGREVPKSSHGTIRIDHYTSSVNTITKETMNLFEKVINPILLVRRINISVCNLIDESKSQNKHIYKQFDLFSNYEEESNNKERELKNEKLEKKIQQTIVDIKNKYGKNSILKGMNLEDGATTIIRNKQVGGHNG